MTLAHGIRLPCDVAKIEQRPAAGRCPQRDKPWVLATAILGSSLGFIEGSIVNLALPAMQSSLHVSSTQLQWVVNAYLLTLGSGMLIGGSLGDRFGLRRVFAIGTTIFGIGALACAFASSLPMLVFARLVQGAGGALLVPGSLALIGTHFEEHERGRAIGTWAGASALTTALGPVVGGALVDRWSWPAVFMLVAPLALVTVVLALWRIPVSKPQTNQPLDSAGAILLALCLASFIYALVAQDGGAMRWMCALLAVICAGAFIWRQRTFSSPVVPFRLFASRAFTGANLMTLALYFALSAVMYFLPFNLIQVRGYSATMAGAVFLPMTLILGLGSTFAGDAIGKLNPRRVLTLGSSIAALGMLALAIPGEQAKSFAGFLPGIVLIGIGITLCVAPLTTIVMNSVNARETGVASGINNTAARLAGLLAIAIMTTIAVPVFRDALARDLTQQRRPAQTTAALTARASQLAELAAPPGVSAQQGATIHRSVANAYVHTFRILVAICAALALLSSVIALTLLPAKIENRVV
jgi:EmrB/QacA subfamily drug resistance transporter